MAVVLSIHEMSNQRVIKKRLNNWLAREERRPDWHTLGTREKNYITQNVCRPTLHTIEIQNLVFSQVRATTLMSLNYRYGPTGHLGVNAAIIDHIRHSPVMGVFTKQNKSTSTQVVNTPGREYTQFWKLTVSSLSLLFWSPLHGHELSQGSKPIRWKTLGHHIYNIVSCWDFL